jgi:hypothetical protein
MVYANWSDESCVKYNSNTTNNYSDRLIQYSVVEFTVIPILFLLGIGMNESNEYKNWNLIWRGFSYVILISNLIFQLLWLMLLLSDFDSDVSQKCDKTSKIYSFSVVALTFHLVTTSASFIVTLLFLIRYLKHLYSSREERQIQELTY